MTRLYLTQWVSGCLGLFGLGEDCDVLLSCEKDGFLCDWRGRSLRISWLIDRGCVTTWKRDNSSE